MWVILRRLFPDALELVATNADHWHPDFVMKLRITSSGSSKLEEKKTTVCVVRLAMIGLRRGLQSASRLELGSPSPSEINVDGHLRRG